MIGVVACINPSGNASLEGAVSGCGGVGTGELVIEMLVDVWHLTELLYKVAPTHLEGRAGMCTPARPQTHRPLLRFHEARQQGLGVLIIVGIVLALYVCSAL